MTAPQTPTPGVPLSAESWTADIAWLRECARYFQRRDTNGEDSAFWSNMANSQNAMRIADRIASLTTPASGSDGLETVEWRWRIKGAGDWCRSEGPAQPQFSLGQPGEIVDLHALVTREAAEKRIGELLDTNAELHELLVSAESQVAALKAALEPFAAMYAQHRDDLIPPDDRHAWGFNNADLTWGDFRRAAETFQALKEGR